MDRTLALLSTYACGLTYESFHAEPSCIARSLAESITSRLPARLLGTSHTSSPDMAGFANGVMVRYLDCNDSYFSPGGGHPSDMIPAALALADPLGCDGRIVITAIVLAYEVFSRLSDQVVAGDLGWDQGILASSAQPVQLASSWA